MSYAEDEYLMLSGIQHFEFCRRQWALIHIEQQWDDNLRTVEGEIMHKNAHDIYFTEKRKNVIVSRGMPVYSHELGINGICDVVEFSRIAAGSAEIKGKGIKLNGREGLYIAEPIEYKRGQPKNNDEDLLQLAAQVMCLEEMLCCDIQKASLYYGEIRRRYPVEITEELKEKVRKITAEMHQYYKRRYTPKVRRSKSCNACSLRNICLPELYRYHNAEEYIDARLKEN
ncbi:MAG TPA: CRISPR-associated protein Cas4 [Lachnospiraceae bacterium]|mgnify:CR=1 FL=1|nr:CRISPR-associated protein Cas4 [Lachnospiraceae bacterium]